ncbi:conserved hypothetical protein [Candidatus Methylobacter favarea]|uniref:DUF2382 domain-containing protein n=1 Tax=Candidatus Methylobacter favarea TaxID=2707345 RepID=A0A8S0X7Q0_9GAMM|nr:YsnF/AvaK domain-containing protein [Candidatus Methylobacter favarea]CAA9890277.1 conserved hypothetical protein [Candidatus Methylobacter favarea]
MNPEDDSLRALDQAWQEIDSLPAEQAARQEAVIPVIEEQLHIEKKVSKAGTVRISKQVTEHEQTVTIPLLEEEIQVERVAVNQFVDSPPPALRYEGDTMIIPIIREVAVLEKRLMLVEELHIVKRQNQKQETRQVTLRKEEVAVERSNAKASDPDKE